MLLGEHVETQSVSEVFQSILSTFQLIPSWKCVDDRACDDVVKSLMKGVEVGGDNLVTLNGDNIRWKEKGAEPGYKQEIIFRDVVVCSRRLEEILVYHINQQETLSWSWELLADWLDL